jgi:hypothetical protein
MLSLYVDDSGRSSLHRSGFSWLAAIALPLWALHRRLWRTLIAVSLLSPFLHTLVGHLNERVPGQVAQGLLALAWLLAWSLACGAMANRWHRHCLERAGYRVIATEPPPPVCPRGQTA